MGNCVRPRCKGTYDADGHCDTCGYPPPEEPVTAEEKPDRQPPTPGPTGPTRTGPTRTGPAGTGPRRSTGTRGRHGADPGIPPIPRHDPESAVLRDPQVPQSRRKCRECDQPLGRDHGYCPRDRTPYSFLPRLEPGDRIERYEVRGCLAYGGLGWIYLARDVNLSEPGSEFWVVLKGLIDVGDPDAIAAAMNERRFLVEVNHPNIVQILNFVQHPDPFTGATVGYIVMEYLPGQSLREIHLGPDKLPRPLPLPTVLGYGSEVLRALGYLHRKGLAFCDLKPDNVMQVDDQVKLIDLGAVVRLTGHSGPYYGTVGFQAPELERNEPTHPGVASDLHTVGRTLAVLSFNFAKFTTTYRHSLPTQADIQLLKREDSFYRLLCRATHPDPALRFGSAEEMREQLLGVLAEVLSIEDDEAQPVRSERFTPERRVFGTGAGVVGQGAGADPVPANGVVNWTALPRYLPTPLVDLADPNAAFLATLGVTEPDRLIGTLGTVPVPSPEVRLRLVDARIAAGDIDGAWADLGEFAAAAAPADWRAAWYRGLLALAEERPGDAEEAFGEVYDALPGELAPKLALAAAAEWAGRYDRAEALYDRVWRTDTSYVSAVFGLARVLRQAGRLPDVVAALDQVPETSAQHVIAQVAAIRAQIEPERVEREDLVDASDRLEKLQMDIERRARLSIEVLTAQLNWTLGHPPGPGERPDGDFDERHLREKLEKAYRNLAKIADDPDDRSKLVDKANDVRPTTLL